MKRFRPSRWLPFALAVVALTLLRAPSAHAQAATLSGRITSESGQPLENANVFITEMNISVAANAQGRYTIVIPAERVRGQTVVLRARGIGHLAQQRPVTLRAGAQTFDFELKRDINRLEEVVVTGMTAGTEQAKTTFTVAALNAEQDLQVPTTNPLQELAGKVPGAQVTSTSGRPGAAPDIILRGPHSINATGRSQGPLILVDGIILNGNTSDINPEDIESIEVVKGAAASALYGSRAGDGIISITTKSGKNASPGLHIDGRQETGFSQVNGTYEFAQNHMLMMDETGTRFCIKQSGLPSCSRTVDMAAEAYRINDQGGLNSLTPYQFERDYGIANTPSFAELKGIFMANTWPVVYNPIDQAATTNPYYSTTVDLTGRSTNTGYFASFNNLVNDGAVKFLSGYTRQSARVNVDQQFGDRWSTEVQTYFQRSNQGPDANQWFGLTRQHPNTDLLATDSKGRLFIRPDPTAETGQNYNPLYDNLWHYQVNRADRFLGSMTNTYKMTNWLNFDATTSIDNRRSSLISQWDKGYRTTDEGNPSQQGTISTGAAYNASYNVRVAGTATHDFTSDLASRLQLAYTYEDQQAQNNGGDGDALAVPGLLTLTNATASLSGNYSETTVKAMGVSGGLNLQYKDRYIFDGALRNDGSSLFGAAQRWHSYYRASGAWIVSEEPWFKLGNQLNELKLHAAVGTAGGRPRFSAQYEAFSIGAGGSISATTLGNKNLRPENTLETEYGVDGELFHKYGVSVTYARDITSDQILQVPPSVSSGFSSQWLNAGTLEGRNWEASLNIPVLTRRSLVWTARINMDQNRSVITQMDVPDFFDNVDNARVRYAVGERYGTIYGKQFVTKCSQLPSDFAAQCGPGKEWQSNDQGYIVWVGAGNTYKDGITKNLWQASRGGCVINGVATSSIVGAINCVKAGGRVNNPWGQPTVNWGMLQVIRDSSANPKLEPLGNGLPLWKASLAQNFSYKKFNMYIMFDRSYGNGLFNEDRHWSLGDFMTQEEDQAGKSVADAKPIGYYWRAPAPDHSKGVGGEYDVLGPNSITFENASFTKLRELSASYNVGRLPRISGDWTVTVIGQNLYTWTKYTGWDPDIGDNGGDAGSAALVGVQSYPYPSTRRFTLTLSSKF